MRIVHIIMPSVNSRKSRVHCLRTPLDDLVNWRRSAGDNEALHVDPGKLDVYMCTSSAILVRQKLVSPWQDQPYLWRWPCKSDHLRGQKWRWQLECTIIYNLYCFCQFSKLYVYTVHTVFYLLAMNEKAWQRCPVNQRAFKQNICALCLQRFRARL